MNKPNSILLFLFLITSILHAQDIIITQEGEEIECKVLEIDPPKVKYRPINHPDGPIRNIQIEDIFMIKYENGSKELFKEEKNTTSKKTTRAKYQKYPFSVGLGISTGTVSGTAEGGFKLTFSHEIKDVPLRFNFNASPIISGIIGPTVFYIIDLDVEYLFKLNEEKLELSPIIGFGGVRNYYFIRNPNFVFKLGGGVNFRLHKRWSFYAQPAFYVNLSDIDYSFFQFSLGIRYNFGKYKMD